MPNRWQQPQPLPLQPLQTANVYRRRCQSEHRRLHCNSVATIRHGRCDQMACARQPKTVAWVQCSLRAVIAALIASTVTSVRIVQRRLNGNAKVAWLPNHRITWAPVAVLPTPNIWIRTPAPHNIRWNSITSSWPRRPTTKCPKRFASANIASVWIYSTRNRKRASPIWYVAAFSRTHRRALHGSWFLAKDCHAKWLASIWAICRVRSTWLCWNALPVSWILVACRWTSHCGNSKHTFECPARHRKSNDSWRYSRNAIVNAIRMSLHDCDHPIRYVHAKTTHSILRVCFINFSHISISHLVNLDFRYGIRNHYAEHRFAHAELETGASNACRRFY